MVSILNSMFQDAVNRRGLLRASLAGLVSQLLMPAAQAAKTLYYSESVIFDQELPPVSLANWTVRVVALEFPAGDRLRLPIDIPASCLGMCWRARSGFKCKTNPNDGSRRVRYFMNHLGRFTSPPAVPVTLTLPRRSL